MIADIQTSADRARARFIDRAVAIANHLGSRDVMKLADAALALRGEPTQLWDAISYQLNQWHRVELAGRAQDAAARFALIGKALGTEVPRG